MLWSVRVRGGKALHDPDRTSARIARSSAVCRPLSRRGSFGNGGAFGRWVGGLRSDPQAAFDAARAVESALRSVRLSESDDKVAVLGRVWEAILGIDEGVLGPPQGRDFVALIAVADTHGVGIAGPGLGGVWAWKERGLTALVQGEHPLLGPPGRPDRLSGILSLDEPCSRVVAVPHDHPVPNIQFSGLARRCGFNP